MLNWLKEIYRNALSHTDITPFTPLTRFPTYSVTHRLCRFIFTRIQCSHHAYRVSNDDEFSDTWCKFPILKLYQSSSACEKNVRLYRGNNHIWCSMPQIIMDSLCALILCFLLFGNGILNDFPVQTKQPWTVLVNGLDDCTEKLDITKAKQSRTKLCPCFMRCRVFISPGDLTLIYIMLSVFNTYPELFQKKILSLVDAVLVDKYYLLSLTPGNTENVRMEVTSRLWHETVYSILLSNTTGDLLNCALDIVHKKNELSYLPPGTFSSMH